MRRKKSRGRKIAYRGLALLLAVLLATSAMTIWAARDDGLNDAAGGDEADLTAPGEATEESGETPGEFPDGQGADLGGPDEEEPSGEPEPGEDGEAPLAEGGADLIDGDPAGEATPSFDPQPETMEEVQTAIDLWEQGGDKPRWAFEVPAELLPEGYRCAAVEGDEAFGAAYYTVFAGPVATALTQTDGDGYYIIETAEELDQVRDNLSGQYRLYANIDLSTYQSTSVTQSQATTNGWPGIGSSSSPFTGEFDGQGYIISGLWCTRNSTASTPYYQDQGLFGFVDGATIYDVNIVIDDRGLTTSYEVGGLVGTANNGTYIYNCTVSGGFVYASNGGYAGGLVGRTNDSVTSGYARVVIENCYVRNMTAEGPPTSNTSGNYAGGLVGVVYTTDLINCGTENVTAKSYSYPGGLVGAMYGQSTAKGCYAVDVDAGGNGSYPAGLVGAVYGQSSVTDCYVERPVITAGASYPGGLIGAVYEASVVTDCYVTYPTVAAGTSYPGGMFGSIYGNSRATGCYVIEPTVTAGTSYSGGFAGEINGATITDNYVLTPSVSSRSAFSGGFTGHITGASHVARCYVDNPTVSTTGSTAAAYAGGFAGDIYDATNNVVEDCSVRNPIVTSSTAGAGGFVGYVCAVTSIYFNSGTITNCVVESPNVTVATNYAGGFAGHVYEAGATFEGCGVTNPTVYGRANVGGFAGRLYTATPAYWLSTFTDCYTVGGTATAVYSAGATYAGGFVGRTYHDAYMNCFAQTDVHITGNTTSAGGGFAGWFDGAAANTSITNCYATGSVTGTGAGYCGGFIGYRPNTAYVINCYATGTVATTATTGYVGGLIGRNGGTIANYISDCYYDTTTTRQDAPIGGGTTTNMNTYITGLTTTQMIDGSSVNFGFQPPGGGSSSNPWYIEETVTYPFLYYQYDGQSAADTNYNLAQVISSNGVSFGGFRADLDLTGIDPAYTVTTGGAERAYFPYTGVSNYSLTGGVASVPAGSFTPASGLLYSMGGVSASGIVAFTSAPGASKTSDRPDYVAGDPASYTYVKEEVTYEIQVANHSVDYEWLGAVLTDPLAEGVTLLEETITVQYDSEAQPNQIYDTGSVPYYQYDTVNRELTVYLGDLAASEAAGDSGATVRFTVKVEPEAHLFPAPDNIRNLGTVTGTLYAPGEPTRTYTARFDDGNTDPVYSLEVIYYPNGASGVAPASAFYISGEMIVIQGAGDMTYSGMYFHGWSLDPDADAWDPDAVIYRPGDELPMEYSSLNFFAVWNAFPPLLKSLDFYKVDGDDLTGLAGARFSLYMCDNPAHVKEEDHIPLDRPDTCWNLKDDTMVSDVDGLIHLEFVTPPDEDNRYFLLVETRAPDGYVLPNAMWLIYLEDYFKVTTIVTGSTVYDLDMHLEEQIQHIGITGNYLPNYRSNYQLPATGGAGTFRFTLSGALLLGAGLVTLRLHTRKPKRDRRAGQGKGVP